MVTLDQYQNPQGEIYEDKPYISIEQVYPEYCRVNEEVSIKVKGFTFTDSCVIVIYHESEDPQESDIYSKVYLDAKHLNVRWFPKKPGDYKLIVANGHTTVSEPQHIKVVESEEFTPWIWSKGIVRNLTPNFAGFTKPVDDLPQKLEIKLNTDARIAIAGFNFDQNTIVGAGLDGDIKLIDSQFNPDGTINLNIPAIAEDGYFDSSMAGDYDLIISSSDKKESNIFLTTEDNYDLHTLDDYIVIEKAIAILN